MSKFQSIVSPWVYVSLTSLLIVTTFFSLNGFTFNKQAQAQIGGGGGGTTQTLGGWAWSSTIGWIDFDTSLPVTVDSSGNLNGSAWSSNVGWVDFGGLNGFPVNGNGTSPTNAKFAGTSFTGWFRVCAGMDDQTLNPPPDQTTPNNTCGGVTRSDGWDGWISMEGNASDGSSYGVILTDNDVPGNPGAKYLGGYAWGSDVVGWIDMSGVYMGGTNVLPPNPVLAINFVGGIGCTYDAILTWNVENATTYALRRTKPVPPKDITPGSGQATDPGLSPGTLYKYSLTATNSAGSGSASITATTPTGCPLVPPGIGTFTAVPPAVPVGGSCALTWTGIQNIIIPPDTCTITGPNSYSYSLGSSANGSTPSPAINVSSRFTITCSNTAGTVSKQTTCNLKPAFIEF